MGWFQKFRRTASASSQADVFYFAYGSHLAADHLQERCPSATAMGLSRLPKYRLAFSIQSTGWSCGVADVVSEAGQVAEAQTYEAVHKEAFVPPSIEYLRVIYNAGQQ